MQLATLRKNRFTILLIMLMFFFIIVPTLLEVTGQIDSVASHWIVLGVSGLLLVAATHAVSGRRRVTLLAIGLMTSSLIIEMITSLLPSIEVNILHHCLRLIFFGFIIVELLVQLFSPGIVTFDTISASLCVYLLIGALWANLYAVCDIASPGSLGPPGSQAAAAAHHVSDLTHSFRMLYFSLVTLSTVGYGDMVPLTPTTRMLAATEAIMGQIYLLVMVSRLVGIHVAQALTPTANKKD